MYSWTICLISAEREGLSTPLRVVLGKFPIVNFSLFHGGEQCGNGVGTGKNTGRIGFPSVRYPTISARF